MEIKFDPSPVGRPMTAQTMRRANFGQRESIGNPLNMSLRRSSSGATLGSRPSTAQLTTGGSTAMMRLSASATTLAPILAEKLRYFAYFVEPILEYTQKSLPYHHERIRKCILTFFPRDGMIAIDEPRIQNSGYVQGKMLKRSAVNVNGRKLTVDDFAVGSEVEIFGKKFCIVDADTRTRKHYSGDLQKPLDVALEYPDDGFETSRALAEIKYRHHRQEFAKRKEELPRPVTAPGGGASTTMMGASSTKYRGLSSTGGIFVEEGHEVLRFYCAYQDDRPDGDRRRYTLHYFLADETIEIKEVHEDGCGNFPNLLRRSLLPKDVVFNPDNPLVDHKEPSYVTWKDLECGRTIGVWGRQLLLMRCDASTERWFAERGISQHPLQISPDEADAFPETLPPFNGFGAENDLYSMGLSLQPGVIKSTQEDYNRFIMADNKVLRYECTLVGSATGIDREKIFVVNYNLGDDTISVYEPPIRNSGCSGGVFLQRTRYKKHIPDHREGPQGAASRRSGMGSVLSRWLRPADFYPGAEVSFEEATTGRLLQTFRVLRADGYTERVNAEKGLSAENRMASGLEMIAEHLCAARIQVREAFAALEEPSAPVRRTLLEATFRAALRKMEAQANKISLAKTLLDEQLVNEICWQFAYRPTAAAGGDPAFCEPRVLYDEFVDALVIAAPLPQIPERKASSTTQVTTKSFEKSIIGALRHPMNRGNGALRASFRTEDPSGSGRVDADAWFRVLRTHRLHGVLSRDEAQTLKQRYMEPSALSAGIEYERLCDKVFEGNFDDYMAALLMVLPERGDLSGVDVTTFRDHLRKGSSNVPTIRNYLDRVNTAARDCDGDVQRQLSNCMRAFSSAFGRNHRKKMLRKYLMAFDTRYDSTCTRDEFSDSVQRIIAQNYCELDPRELNLLLSYVFPQAWTRQPFDKLLEILVARDVKGVMRIHEAALQQREDPRFQFR